MAINRDTIKKVRFAGLKLKDTATEVGFNGLRTGRNIDISRKRKPYRRAGYSQAVSATIRSAWGDGSILLYIAGTSLLAFDGSTSTTIRSGLTAGGDLSAYRIGNNIYYSNRHETGVYNLLSRTNRTLGLEVPGPVSLEAVTGALPPGRYQAVAVFVREDGQVSGAGVASVIDLETTGGISATVPESSDPSVLYVDLYLSTTNGTELYRAGRTLNGLYTINYQDTTAHLQIPLRSQFRTAPDAFQEIEHFASRMLYGMGNLLVYSDPFAYEQIDRRFNYLPYLSPITMIAVVDSGIFAGTETETWFLRTDGDVRNAVATLVDEHGVVPRTKQYIKGDVIGDGSVKNSMPFWVSKSGNICVGQQDGTVQNLTEKSVIIPEGVKGAAMFRQLNGQNHYIAVINS